MTSALRRIPSFPALRYVKAPAKEGQVCAFKLATESSPIVVEDTFGRAMTLVPGDLFVGTTGYRESRRIYVLGCQCGEVGCWPLTCLINIRNSEVTWQSFEQPHRPARDYSSFGPFVFELAQYEEALRSLPE